jgi:hypothetical protein
MADEKKRGRGNPRKPMIGPKLPRSGDLSDPKAPVCGASYKYKGIEKRCGKRGRHLKHGPA